jgi:acyl transferase domain-containing protein/NADPH:quinone reductase-like Zn-dependent oxidoreductase/NAD(P)-dependent dehydrogenase (short-subunit alcohol dehydrogenase family)/SAM-dependent methyltransferase/acyl carrier protein
MSKRKEGPRGTDAPSRRLEDSPHEPVAIIGIGCRLPGEANDPESFWKLLCDGIDAITEIPAERWDLRAFFDSDREMPGKTNVRSAGFITGIDQFDPEFFGISLREAPCMDPQQRLLLEVAWEALEDGGEVLDIAGGMETGVFVGLSTNDYRGCQGTLRDTAFLDIYTNMGNAPSIAANRISYCLNLLGPSITLDTACSSSLIAVHLACRSLWDGECATALAGGVNAALSPDVFISLNRASMLSPDGRCKAFDSRANGFARAEGAGMVLLKPLTRALADGNPIYALIRGTAANQDGRNIGITVPSQVAQEAVVRKACRAAGVSPRKIHYVEAHGTGTPVGDPIEAHALSAVLCRERAEGSLVVGSVKTNIGHLEAGAGVAGIIKLALMLQHRMVPPNLHFVEPNPQIDFGKLKLRIPTALEPLPAGRVIAGINSFGFGGANAHAVLESPPQRVGVQVRAGHDSSRTPEIHNDGLKPELQHDEKSKPGLQYVLLPLSARSPEVLPEMARRYASFLIKNRGRGPDWLRDVCYTACLHRTHHDHRLTVVASSAEEFAAKLEAFANGEAQPGMVSGQVEEIRRLAFVFSGQGPQWWAMGRQLLAREPVFRQKIEECDRLLRQWSRWSVLEELSADEQRSRLQETAIAQPAIFSLQVALAALWSSWGIEPAAVVGHSVGEVAAAHVAGVLSLEDAARTILHRGRCMALAPPTGRMLAAALSGQEARGLVEQHADRVSLAAINSPYSVTFSGDAEMLTAIQRDLTQRNVFCRFLRVQYAFHSAQMDPVQRELIESLGRLRSHEPRIALFSSVTGASLNGAALDAAYWWRNVRQTVLFADAVNGLIQEGCNDFLEISPHPVLVSAIMECATRYAIRPLVLSSLRRGDDEVATMLGALGALHAAGYRANLRSLFPAGGCCLHLPVYPWKHRRYWQETAESHLEKHPLLIHPLLGRRVKSANPRWENKIEGRLRSLLTDHRVQGKIVFPAAAYVEMALASGRQLFENEGCALEEIELHKALLLPDGSESPSLQLIYDSQQKIFQVFSRANETQDFWILHCSGKLALAKAGNAITEDSTRLLERCREEVSVPELYSRFESLGLLYGPRFQGIQKCWRGQGEVVGWVAPPRQLDDDLCQVPPTLLDSCFQMLLAAPVSVGSDIGAQLYLPARIARVRLHRKPGPEVWVHGRVNKQHRGSLTMSLRAVNQDGKVAIEIEGLVCEAVESARGGSELEDALYELDWQLPPLSSTGTQPPPGYLPNVPALARKLEEAAHRSAIRTESDQYRQLEKEIERLCSCYVVKALEQLGCQFQAGGHIAMEPLCARVVPQHMKALGRYLEMLEEDGLLTRTGSGWTVSQMPDQMDAEDLWRSIFTRLPVLLPELSVLENCGRHLAAILQGQTDPLQLLFAENSFLEQIYNQGINVRPYNQIAQEAVRAVVRKLPEGHVLRILELGAGTGGLTSCVLQELSLLPQKMEYVFTDVSGQFLASAEQKFRHCSFMRYQTLDIEKSPSEQGFDKHYFDLVLASDVLHATSDVRRSLAHIKQLLPGGLLVLVEIDRLLRSAELVFSLTKGWWSFIDTDLRAKSPVLRRPRWVQLLKEEGFLDVATVSDTDNADDSFHVVLLAKGPPVDAPQSCATTETSLAAQDSEAGATWLLFTDAGGVAAQLARRLATRGDRCITVASGAAYEEKQSNHFQVRPAEKEDMRRLVETATARFGRVHGVVFLWGLDKPNEEKLSLTDLEEAQHRGCYSLLTLVQVLTEMNQFARLSLVTRETQPVGREGCLRMAQTPLWGLGRVIMNEQPRFFCKMIDLGGPGNGEETEALFQELSSDAAEEEIALRGSARYVLRMARSTAASRGYAQCAAGSPFRLEITKPGVLDDLILRPIRRRGPEPGEVEIEVLAAGLNFQDLMKAMGVFPREIERCFMLGNECAGRIVAVGDGVTEFRIGDRVFALVTAHALSSHVTCAAGLATHCPDNFSMEAAVTIPVAFLTAAYALRKLAKMAAGERVLIHSAAGGVGLAAVQMAQCAGCEVFATGGDDNKREFLRALGVPHVMDSRSLSFADEVMEITRGEGVDIVLNSLAGEALIRSISLLRREGRFIEIGKRDIYGNSKIGLRPFRTNICFHSLDLMTVVLTELPEVRRLLSQIVSDLEQGKLHPLPRRLFSMTDAAGAFRHMMRGTHIGKIVVTLTGNEVPVEPFPEPGKSHFDPNATYLITGGLGGFGLLAARWMVENGARDLVLLGRSGASSDAACQAVQELRQLSASVTVAQADIAKETDLAAVLEDIRLTKRPLRGVIHAAMVLDDGVLSQLNAARLQKVMAPKILGAWNLHCQTLGEPLDFFVLFSSVSSMIGNPGQANYAAGNAFLDSLAYYRQQQGLPALAINWGYITEAGYVARNKAVGESLSHAGLGALGVRSALMMLGRLLQTRLPSVGIIKFDWGQWAKTFGTLRRQPRFSSLMTQGDADLRSTDLEKANREMIFSANDAERRRLVEAFVRDKAAKVLRTSIANLDMSKPLHELGLDSLMAVELMNRIEGELGLAVPTAKLLGGQNLLTLTTTLIEIIEGSSSSPIEPSQAANPAAVVEKLSDAEVDALLQDHAGKAEEILARAAK